MEVQEIKCDYCNYFKATTKDYRADGKHLSCRWCAGLNDVTIYQIQRDRLNPITFYDSLDFENMGADALIELRDYYFDIIFGQIEDDDPLTKILEVERALTLKETS
ncbi:MAG: hypothetical protein JRJ45_00125 [Deltaproteobacteria bacterium]|nr:hypothetical protein [Deltaproteobacteria bacterium]